MEKINTPTEKWAKGNTNGYLKYEKMLYRTHKKNANLKNNTPYLKDNTLLSVWKDGKFGNTQVSEAGRKLGLSLQRPTRLLTAHHSTIPRAWPLSSWSRTVVIQLFQIQETYRYFPFSETSQKYHTTLLLTSQISNY